MGLEFFYMELCYGAGIKWSSCLNEMGLMFPFYLLVASWTIIALLIGKLLFRISTSWI